MISTASDEIAQQSRRASRRVRSDPQSLERMQATRARVESVRVAASPSAHDRDRLAKTCKVSRHCLSYRYHYIRAAVARNFTALCCCRKRSDCFVENLAGRDHKPEGPHPTATSSKALR
jgi:hypothetical protein